MKYYNFSRKPYIPRDIFFVFQTDTLIFKENDDLINKLLTYDYVEAHLSRISIFI